jgi:exodeoxyribonuclease VII large subunit
MVLRARPAACIEYVRLVAALHYRSLHIQIAYIDRLMPSRLPVDKITPSDVLTVSALNQAVSRALERSFPLSWVAGEISNFTRAASGHWYFTLKDDAAQVRAVMFRGRAQYADFSPREGDRGEVRALVTLYAPRGD